MRSNIVRRAILRFFSLLVIFGGLVRLVANRSTFQSFLIGELWTSHPYFIYIYRLLGALVLLIGVTLFIIASDPQKYALVLRTWGISFFVIGVLMLFAGYFVRLSLVHYLPDFAFCFIIGFVCMVVGKGRSEGSKKG
ncbi:hypothetical protein AMJ83_11430 [candidate division WOR_3 bacterium SM23_42]|uniref:DUF4345 domain-containing protein n=1 Tax=candidate division WOR_3 bacterium SM23_42 TaxID=1703779 RepID=A0A0S8FPJ5_UNCW3|nr:MAG: hypothetical protein AMJ83_11430 [candidate division WOR_3 bacterium SM23_42]